MKTDSKPRSPASSILMAMRPSQWTKNMIVLAAFFFAFWDQSREVPLQWIDLTLVIPAALLFCLASSGVYVLNDIRDAEADRHHPVKKLRPIASGAISPTIAWILAAACLIPSVAGAIALSRPFAATLVTYLVIQVIYTFLLKQLAMVDVMVISTGFVIRAIAGAVVMKDVTISPWLLLCTFLLALFLALCKRRHEKLLNNDDNNLHRPNLEKYDKHLLDQLISITAGATIVAYSIYTLWPETVAKFDTQALGLTIPFVVFGIFRYLDIVYRHEEGGRPERVLLTDIPLLIDLALYGITLLAIFLLPR